MNSVAPTTAWEVTDPFIRGPNYIDCTIRGHMATHVQVNFNDRYMATRQTVKMASLNVTLFTFMEK